MRASVLLVSLIGLALGASGAAGAAKGGTVLKHSDVVSMYDASPEQCRAFSITSIAWGGRPQHESELAAFRKNTIDPLHAMGVRFTSSVGMVTEFGLFMEECPEWEQAICVTPRGEKLRVPWLWDLSHDGNPAYWFCTNSPLYRTFLRDQVTIAARTGADGVHIDDHAGSSGNSWLEGCYCRNCVAGFRSYLREHVPARVRQEAGVEDIASFDYGKYVRAWLDAHPGKRAWDAPLAEQYRVYELRAAEAFMAELHALAEQTAGHPISFGANEGVPDSGQLADYRTLTQFTSEVGQEAESGLAEDNVNAVIAYKVAAALGRPLTATAGGSDWAFVKANQRPELVRAWIAEAYAFGQYLMTPVRQWCYTEKLGTHWYDGPPEEYAPTYGFIRQHPALFDGLENVAQVAVLHSTGAARRGGEQAEREVVHYLLKSQVPFDIVVAGDEWVPAHLTWPQVARYKWVIAPPDLTLDAAQQRVIDGLRREGRLVEWQGRKTTATLPAPWVQLSGAPAVWTTLRRDAKGTRAVCHLLNRDYDAASGKVRPTGPFTLAISAAAVGKKVSKATLYAPGAEAQQLKVTRSAKGISIDMPAVGVWGVVELKVESRELRVRPR